jgi:hypothetical protein
MLNQQGDRSSGKFSFVFMISARLQCWYYSTVMYFVLPRLGQVDLATHPLFLRQQGTSKKSKVRTCPNG